MRSGTSARIRGVDPVHVGEDLALVGLECNRQRHGAGVRAAAADGGDVALVIDALESRDHRHHPGIQVSLRRFVSTAVMRARR